MVKKRMILIVVIIVLIAAAAVCCIPQRISFAMMLTETAGDTVEAEFDLHKHRLGGEVPGSILIDGTEWTLKGNGNMISGEYEGKILSTDTNGMPEIHIRIYTKHEFVFTGGTGSQYDWIGGEQIAYYRGILPDAEEQIS